MLGPTVIRAALLRTRRLRVVRTPALMRLLRLLLRRLRCWCLPLLMLLLRTEGAGVLRLLVVVALLCRVNRS